MKYIRMKSGKIYHLCSYQSWDGYYQCYDGRPFFADYWRVRKTSAVKLADTIEELCDEFVVNYESNQHIVYQDLEWARDKASRGTFKYVIYGAIWTDKGLIYIAKMNEKGVLKLL